MVKSNIKKEFNCNIEKLWDIITDNTKYTWRSDLSKIEVVDDKHFIEYAKNNYPTSFTITAKEYLKEYKFDIENTNIKGRWLGIFKELDNGNVLFKVHIADPLAMFSYDSKIITDAKVVNNDNKIKLVLDYNKEMHRNYQVYYYGIDKIELKKDGIYYDLEEDLKSIYSLNYNALTDVVIDDYYNGYGISKGKYFNILTCYNLDDGTHQEYIASLDIKLDKNSCRVVNKLRLK